MKVAKLFLLLLALSPNTVLAWGGKTHRAITHALVTLVKNISGKCGLVEGSVAPDKRGDGWLPPACHGYDPSQDDRAKRRRGIAPKSLAQIINTVRARKMTKGERAFQIGRALHITQDLTQPFHTGSGNDERRYHAPYEKWVDKRADAIIQKALVNFHKDSMSLSGRPKEVSEELARRTRKDYWRLHKLCRQKPWGEELESFTARRIADGFHYSLYVLEEANRGHGPNDNEGFWRLFSAFIFALVFHLLAKSSSPSIPKMSGRWID